MTLIARNKILTSYCIVSIIFLLGFLLLFFSSCASVYIPSVPNTPLLTEKGQLKAGVHGSFNKNINIPVFLY